MTRKIFAIAAAFACVAVACQLFVKIEDERGANADADAGSGEPPDPCVHVRAPDQPPNASDEGELPAITFAARRFAVNPAGGGIGYDIDNRCTEIAGSTTNGPGCTPVQGLAVLPDEDGGIDNAFAQAANDTSLAGDIGATLLNGNVDEGIFTMLVQVTHWNGKPDDDKVRVAMFTSSIVCRPYDAGPQAGELYFWDGGLDIVRPRPAWDGRDSWTFVDGSLPVLPDTPKGYLINQSTPGYVSKGKLVVRAGPLDPPLSFGLGQGAITLAAPVLVADIAQVDGKYLLQNGIVSGVAPANQLLGFVDRIELKDIPLCVSGGVLKDNLEKKLCAVRDLNVAGDAAGPCDAVSFAFAFNAEQTTLAGATLTPPVEKCNGLTAASCVP